MRRPKERASHHDVVVQYSSEAIAQLKDGAQELSAEVSAGDDEDGVLGESWHSNERASPHGALAQSSGRVVAQLEDTMEGPSTDVLRVAMDGEYLSSVEVSQARA